MGQIAQIDWHAKQFASQFVDSELEDGCSEPAGDAEESEHEDVGETRRERGVEVQSANGLHLFAPAEALVQCQAVGLRNDVGAAY